MSGDIEMMESFPSINPLKRKGEFDLQEPGQGNSYSVGDDAESPQKIRRVQSDGVAENPSALGTIDEPLAQAGVSFGEELQGELVFADRPVFAGGYANIYRGTWRSPDGTLTNVAIKRLKPIQPTTMSSDSDLIKFEQIREKRLKREVFVWARLTHSNIHPLLGFRTQPEPCLVSPWCQNGNLASYLCKGPSLSQPEKLRLLVQTADGLAFLHSQSPPICHADIKPENILVNDLCEAALSDFGLSRVILELGAPTGFTTGQGPKGSQKYMAPELFMIENCKPTLETDVYAFGGLTLAVMSGRAPFAQATTAGNVLYRIVSGIHPKPEEHRDLDQDDPLWSTMVRCWTHEPQKRPTISDVVVELREQEKLVDPFSAERPPHRNGLTRPTTPVLTKGAHSDIEQLPSIVQPGSTVRGPLPGPLLEDIKLPPRPTAQGAYSDIYKVPFQENGRERSFCIKVLRRGGMDGFCVDRNVTHEARFERRIKRETAIWAAADHPNVLRFLGYRMVDGSPWLISDWASHGNLAAFLRQHDISKLEKLKMLQDANTGLAYLHGLKPPIAHGDLKPENILILDDLTVALSDFGTSRVVVELGIHNGMMTTAVAAAGKLTAGYHARELILGQSIPTPASDVYAMAGVILATLTGKVPFHEASTHARVIMAICMGEMCSPEHYPELPADDPLWELLRQCWAPKPLERPSANEVIQNLQSAIQRELELPPSYAEGGIEVDSN